MARFRDLPLACPPHGGLTLLNSRRGQLTAAEPATCRRPWRLRLHLLFQDALLGRRKGSAGEYPLIVQLGQLAQLRYPRRLVIRSRSHRRGLGSGGWVNGNRWLGGGGGTGAGWSRQLLACGVHPELTPEPLGLRRVPGLGEPPGAERGSRVGHRAYVTQLCVADLKAPAADRADQVVVRPIGHHGHEVQAHRLLRTDVVEEHLVMAVRAYARRDLALILRMTWPEAENHHHAVIKAGSTA